MVYDPKGPLIKTRNNRIIRIGSPLLKRTPKRCPLIAETPAYLPVSAEELSGKEAAGERVKGREGLGQLVCGSEDEAHHAAIIDFQPARC